jgi:hypothetical protein
MTQRRRIILVVCIILFIVIGAYLLMRQRQNQLNIETLNTSEYTLGWYEGSNSCEYMPCWYGISPGHTTLDEALNTLDRLDVTYISNSSPIGPEDGQVSWERVGTLGYPGSLSHKDNKVIYISVIEAICLPEMIEAFGTPTHVATNEERGGIIVSTVIWLSKGITVIPRGSTVAHGNVDSSYCAGSIVLFTPTASPDQIDPVPIGKVVEWHGFDSAENYLGK